MSWLAGITEDLRLLDSFYFSVVTLATVGYGDFTPQTDAGKLFTAVYVLVGIMGPLGAALFLLIMRRIERVAPQPT